VYAGVKAVGTYFSRVRILDQWGSFAGVLENRHEIEGPETVTILIETWLSSSMIAVGVDSA
jgi:hypothetical protein